MEIKILFDKERLNRNFYKGWGVAYLIADKILFDTGCRGDWLVYNMQKLKIDVHKIEKVVISHNHWDHTGGLWKLLELNKNIKVYICPGFESEFKLKIKQLGCDFVELKEITEIEKNIYSTGQIEGGYKNKPIMEQSLILKSGSYISVLTGCAHPGIINILSIVRDNFPFNILYSVFGGFHLKDSEKKLVESIVKQFRKMGVKKVAPSHCSGKIAEKIFKKEYQDDFISLKVGQTVNIPI